MASLVDFWNVKGTAASLASPLDTMVVSTVQLSLPKHRRCLLGSSRAPLSQRREHLPLGCQPTIHFTGSGRVAGGWTGVEGGRLGEGPVVQGGLAGCLFLLVETWSDESEEGGPLPMQVPSLAPGTGGCSPGKKGSSAAYRYTESIPCLLTPQTGSKTSPCTRYYDTASTAADA